jgi:hypothetical protein
MAITQRGNNVMAMTAVDDEFPDKIYVTGFTAVTDGTGGRFEVHNSDDELVWHSPILGDNDQGESSFPYCGVHDGVKLASLPASGTLLIHFK